jgi:hypothetical protein
MSFLKLPEFHLSRRNESSDSKAWFFVFWVPPLDHWPGISLQFLILERDQESSLLDPRHALILRLANPMARDDS